MGRESRSPARSDRGAGETPPLERRKSGFADQADGRRFEVTVPLYLQSRIDGLNAGKTTVDRLLRMADAALYGAKNAGRNRVALA